MVSEPWSVVSEWPVKLEKQRVGKEEHSIIGRHGQYRYTSVGGGAGLSGSF